MFCIASVNSEEEALTSDPLPTHPRHTSSGGGGGGVSGKSRASRGRCCVNPFPSRHAFLRSSRRLFVPICPELPALKYTPGDLRSLNIAIGSSPIANSDESELIDTLDLPGGHSEISSLLHFCKSKAQYKATGVSLENAMRSTAKAPSPFPLTCFKFQAGNSVSAHGLPAGPSPPGNRYPPSLVA